MQGLSFPMELLDSEQSKTACLISVSIPCRSSTQMPNFSCPITSFTYPSFCCFKYVHEALLQCESSEVSRLCVISLSISITQGKCARQSVSLSTEKSNSLLTTDYYDNKYSFQQNNC